MKTTDICVDAVQRAFRMLFQVWDGTENADDILEDAARTIGYEVFGIEAENNALNNFVAGCRHGHGGRND